MACPAEDTKIVSLAPGQKLGVRGVVAVIGRDGMGEVYRARDTKLDRDVALKVLPEAFTADPDRLTPPGADSRKTLTALVQRP